MTKGEQMTVPRVVSSGAPVASSAFGDRLRGVLTRPSRTFDAMTDPDAWVFPAIVMFLGYLVYMLASGVRAAELMHRLMDESGSKITSQREGGEFLSRAIRFPYNINISPAVLLPANVYAQSP